MKRAARPRPRPAAKIWIVTRTTPDYSEVRAAHLNEADATAHYFRTVRELVSPGAREYGKVVLTRADHIVRSCEVHCGAA